MTDKLVLLALCALLLVHHHDQVAVSDVVALLVAMCGAALGEWLLAARSPRSWMPETAISITALFFPPLALMLPACAYDAARWEAADHVRANSFPMPRHMPSAWRFMPTADPDVSDDNGSFPYSTRATLASMARHAWILPLAVALLQQPDGRTTLPMVGLLACIGFAWGMQSHNAARLAMRLRDAQDERRSSVRDLRSRLANVQEERAEAAHIAILNERTRIARDIHDNVGHLLTRAIMQAEADRVVAEARNDALSAKQFAEVGDSIKEAMTMVRRSVHDLDDAGVDFASWIADAARSTGRLHVELRNTITGAVPAPVARCLAAVIRESLANAARHSSADRVIVTVQEFPAFWQLVVQDNGGRTTQTHANRDRRGMGLADIEARVRAFDGTCSWGPNVTGWRVFVSIPKHVMQEGGQS